MNGLMDRRQRGGRRSTPDARGFSLIELLLALALGLIVVTGIVQLFVGNSRSYGVMTGQARLQENGRFALDLIARAARSAGFIGCTREPDAILRGLVGNWDLIPEADISRPIMAYPAGATAAVVPRSSGGVDTNVFFRGAGIDTSRIPEQTDVVVFRSLRSPGARLAEVLQPDGQPLIATAGGQAPVAVNDVVAIANCEQAAVVRVTGVTQSASSARLSFAAGGVTAANAAASASRYVNAFETLSPVGKAYGTDTLISPIDTTYFFIAPGAAASSAPSAGTGNATQPPLALWQKVGMAAPVELVQGVEDLDVLLGLDNNLTDGVASATRYVTTGALVASQSGRVVSVRVSVTANSVDAVNEGAPLRRTFTRTIQLRNANPEA
jgi:type IV pilus assembly protein PilW